MLNRRPANARALPHMFERFVQSRRAEPAMYRLDFAGRGTINDSIYIDMTYASLSHDTHLGQWFLVPGLSKTGLDYTPSCFLRFYAQSGFGGLEVRSIVDGREGVRIFSGIGPQLFTGELSRPKLKHGFYDRLEDYTSSNTTLKIAALAPLPDARRHPAIQSRAAA